jgi:hypothetical protein
MKSVRDTGTDSSIPQGLMRAGVSRVILPIPLCTMISCLLVFNRLFRKLLPIFRADHLSRSLGLQKLG